MNLPRAILAFLLSASCWAANNPDIAVALAANAPEAIWVDEQAQVTATLKWPSGDFKKAEGSYAWSVDPVGVATVSGTTKTATVTGRTSGTAKVTCTWTAPGFSTATNSVTLKVLVLKTRVAVKAAGNPAEDRKTVGACEEVVIYVSPSHEVDWKATKGEPLVADRGEAMNWTAPPAADTATITATIPQGGQRTVDFASIVPSGATGVAKVRLTDSTTSKAYIGMRLEVTIQPTTVSFYALETMEEIVGPTNAGGYWDPAGAHPPPSHDGQAGGGVWNSISSSNLTTDTATTGYWPAPWSTGTFTWRIPRRWRPTLSESVGTPYGNPIDQVFTLAGSGQIWLTKFGQTVSNRP